MLATLAGKVTLARELQPLKRLAPRAVTPLGIVREVRALHPLKALSPMVVTVLGIVSPESA
jgi:hypothetical protein